MILTKFIDVTISNQGKHYASLGYENTKQGTKLTVPLEHLPKQCNKKIKCKCDDCGHLWKATYQSVVRQGNFHRCRPCTRKLIGKTMDMTNTIAATKKRVGSKHPRWNSNKSDFKKYAYEVRMLTETNYKKYKEIINPTDLPRTLCGVDGGYQLDHKISIKSGFDKGHSPNEIACIQNLQMLPWSENRSKW